MPSFLAQTNGTEQTTSLARLLEGIKAAVFDFDGTLVNSHEMWKSIDKRLFDWLEMDPPPDYLQAIEGKGLPEIASYVIDRLDVKHRRAEEVLEYLETILVDAFSTQVKFVDGAPDFLLAMASRGIPIGIATSTTHQLVEAFFAKHPATRKLIACVVTSEDVAHAKPAPDVFLRCFEALGVHPSEGAIFEDTVVGLSAASKTGSLVFCVLSQPDACEEKGALSDHQIKEYTELICQFRTLEGS